MKTHKTVHKVLIKVEICKQSKCQRGFRLVMGDKFRWFKRKGDASAALFDMLKKFKLRIEPAPKARYSTGMIIESWLTEDK